MQRYKGIVIGCGKIGVMFESNEGRIRPRSHASSLVGNDTSMLAALVDPDPARLESAKTFFPQVPGYTDLAACLYEIKPDIAIVAASTPTHADIIIALARAHVPMIIGEKPVASTLEEAGAIKRALVENGSTYVLNYQRRFFPLFENAKRAIAQGRLGRIQHVSCYYDNGLYNNGGHAIDAVTFLLGERARFAIGMMNDLNKTHPENDPNIDGFLFMESGAVIGFQSFDQKKFGIHELRIYADAGALIIRDYGYAMDWIPLKPSSISGLPQLMPSSSSTQEDARSMTADALDEAIACHEAKRLPRSGIDNGIETLCVLEALTASAREGGTKTAVVYTGNK